MYQFTERGHIRRLADGAIIPPDPGNADYAAIIAGDVEVEPYQTPAPVLADYQRSIQAHVDATAALKGYDSGASCAGYATSSVAGWAAEAAAFIAWRDAVWLYVYQQLADVEAGQRAQPAPAELVAELPAITWPA